MYPQVVLRMARKSITVVYKIFSVAAGVLV